MVGKIWTMPVSIVSFGVAIGTAATPGMCRISSARPLTSPSGSLLPMMSAVTTIGLL